jgi:hypothetical protein
MSDLNDEIQELISLKKEGEFWDFKLKHHDNAVDLVKDITCLANTVRHDGSRYLILGVCPDTYHVSGIASGETIRSQADIISTLRNANFAAAHFPDIRLETIAIDGRRLDVIVIADTAHKPYYLETDYTKTGKTMRAGVIYSRTQDANTPNDRSAPATDIEKMWRERFGLDGTPLDRLKNYLLDFDGWEEINENNWYYKQFPEFTVCPTEEETWEVEAGENWVRSCPNPRAFVRPMVAKFHQTIIAKVCCIYFDEMRGLIPAAHTTFVNDSDDQWFFSFSADELDFIFLQFFTRKNGCELLEQGLSGGRSARLPIIVFSSNTEKTDFIESLRESPIQILQQHQFTRRPSDPTISEQDCRIVTYCRAVIDRFRAWKSPNMENAA